MTVARDDQIQAATDETSAIQAAMHGNASTSSHAWVSDSNGPLGERIRAWNQWLDNPTFIHHCRHLTAPMPMIGLLPIVGIVWCTRPECKPDIAYAKRALVPDQTMCHGCHGVGTAKFSAQLGHLLLLGFTCHACREQAGFVLPSNT